MPRRGRPGKGRGAIDCIRSLPGYATRMFRVLVVLLSVSVWLPSSAAMADEALWSLLAKGGQVVLIRHAVTDPGVGDPPGFRLDDCRTQRNLSAAGRVEAERLGAAMRAHGIRVSRVLSSPWCRCLETARIAFGGAAQVEPALGNLFGQGDREQQLAGFRAIVAAAPKRGNLVLVTHGSTTAAFTGIHPGTAEMVIVTPERGGKYRVAGRIPLAP